MIDIQKEKDSKLTIQECYGILDLATQAANDNGFMNSLVFERTMYLFAATLLYKEREQEITELILEKSPLAAWDVLLEDGTLENMQADFENTLNCLAELGANWYEEYSAFAHSARGLLGDFSKLAEDVNEQASSNLLEVKEDPTIMEALQIADKWGMNNTDKKTSEIIEKLSE